MDQDRYASFPLVSPETIFQTVLYDGQTRLWFCKIFSLPGVVEKLQSYMPEAGMAYKNYRQFSLTAYIFMTVSVIGGYAAVFSAVDRRLFILSAVLAGGMAIFFLSRRRRCVAQLASSLVKMDQDGFPPGMTLYQMGEIYARQYQAPSLVETIGAWDRVVEPAFGVIYFGASCIYFLSFTETIGWSLAGFFFVLGCFQAAYLIRK